MRIVQRDTEKEQHGMCPYYNDKPKTYLVKAFVKYILSCRVSYEGAQGDSLPIATCAELRETSWFMDVLVPRPRLTSDAFVLISFLFSIL